MRAILAAVLLLLAVPVYAQETPRVRWSQPEVPESVPVNPLIEITSPTSGTTHSTPDASVSISGIVSSLAGKLISSVTWSCATCTPTSGTALLAVDNTWNTPTSSGGGTVFFDDFEGSTNLNLALRTPVIGTSWSEPIDTSSVPANYALQQRTGGYATINSQEGGGTPLVVAIASPDPSDVNYDVETEIELSSVGFDDPAGIVFGYADASNYCAAVLYSSVKSNPQMYLIKRVAGVLTELDTANVTLVTGDTIKVSVRGTSLEVFQSGVSRMTATDSFCDDANSAGFGIGSFRSTSGDDLSNGWHFRDFRVVDQDGASSGVGLASGANTIIFTVTDEDANTGTDSIVITREAADSVAPVVVINSPTLNPTYGTSTQALTPAGTCTDNVAPFVVSLSCAECTPTTRTATLTGTSWVADNSFTLAAGPNAIIAACQDAEANEHTDTLTVAYTAADTTDPVVTITTNGGANFGTSTSPTTIGGTCTDAVGCTSIVVECDVCTGGTVTGKSDWSLPFTYAAGPNVITIRGRDEAGNEGTDTITVTYTPPALAATDLTGAVMTFTVGTAKTVCLAASGGTPPYTWTKVSGTYTTGFSLSSGCIVYTGSGSAVANTYTNHVYRVTDNVAATDDTAAVTITVQAAGADGPQTYFEDLLARGDCYKAWSLRPVAGQTLNDIPGDAALRKNSTNCTHAYWENQLAYIGSPTFGYKSGRNIPYRGKTEQGVFYNPSADTHPDKQDGMKLTIPAFTPTCPNVVNGVATGGTLAQPLTTSSTVVHLSCAAEVNPDDWLLIDGELMKVVAPAAGGNANPKNVLRGQGGTVAAEHLVGAAVDRSNNSVGTDNHIKLPIRTDGSEELDYLITFDIYTAQPNWVGWTGQEQAHKMVQIGGGASQGRGIELEPRFDGCGNSGVNEKGYEHPDCIAGTHIGGISARFYGPITGPGIISAYPVDPVEDPFILEASKWTRYWIRIKQRLDTQAANFQNVTGFTLNQPITDTNDITTVWFNYPAATFDQANGSDALTPTVYTSGNGVGRTIRIGTEMMTVISCAPRNFPNARSCSLARGAHGTAKATHLVNAQAQLSFDLVSMWVGDEDTDATLVFNEIKWLLPAEGTTQALSGRIYDWWGEFDKSGGTVTQIKIDQGFEDWAFYLRNVAVLEGAPGTDWSSIITGSGNRPLR